MRFLKLSLISSLIFASANAYAEINANTGFYIGGAVTMNYYTSPHGSSFSATLLPYNISLRPTIGYRINDYLAAEAGFMSAANESHPANNEWGRDDLRIYSFDLAAKGFIPFESGFSLFGKAGLALTHQYVYNLLFNNSPAPLVDKTSNQIQPLVGAGFAYNFTKVFATELSFTYYGKTDNIGNIDVIALGLTYTFN